MLAVGEKRVDAGIGELLADLPERLRRCVRDRCERSRKNRVSRAFPRMRGEKVDAPSFVKKVIVVSMSAARKTPLIKLDTGTARLCTRTRRSPAADVYRAAHWKWASAFSSSLPSCLILAATALSASMVPNSRSVTLRWKKLP